ATFFFERYAHHPELHSFPTRRSSDLAWTMVLRRWATTKLVRPASRRSRACCTRASVTLSTELVASSRMTTRGSAIMARAKHTIRSEEHTSELQSRENLVCRLLLEKKK